MYIEMGLRVSMPKQNDSGKFSSVTSFNKNLLEKFHIILIAISSNFFINSDNFVLFVI